MHVYYTGETGHGARRRRDRFRQSSSQRASAPRSSRTSRSRSTTWLSLATRKALVRLRLRQRPGPHGEVHQGAAASAQIRVHDDRVQHDQAVTHRASRRGQMDGRGAWHPARPDVGGHAPPGRVRRCEHRAACTVREEKDASDWRRFATRKATRPSPFLST